MGLVSGPSKLISPALGVRFPMAPPLGRAFARLASECSIQKSHAALPEVPEIARVRGQCLRRECGLVRIGSVAVRESGRVHVFCHLEVPRIDQRGKAGHPVNPGGAGGKCLEGGEASSALGVEQPADACHGLFDTWAGPLAGVSRLSKNGRFLPVLRRCSALRQLVVTCPVMQGTHLPLSGRTML